MIAHITILSLYLDFTSARSAAKFRLRGGAQKNQGINYKIRNFTKSEGRSKIEILRSPKDVVKSKFCEVRGT